MGFLFGSKDTPWSQEELKRKREVADALLSRSLQTPRNGWEGARAIVDALGARKLGKKADAREGELREDFNSRFNSAFSGGGGNFGSAGGGSYAPPPPRSQFNLGETETPEQQAAREANSMGKWNGGEISDMQPNMFSTFGNEAAVGGKSGYDLGSEGATTPDAIFRSTLLAGGLPEHAVDGIMMNAHDESGFDPTAVGDGGNAFGFLQWNGPRMKALKDWSASQGLNPADPKAQALFTLYELQGPEAAAGRSLLGTSTPGEAGAVFVNQYERPAESHRARREAAYLQGGGTLAGGSYSGSNAPQVDPMLFGNMQNQPDQPQMEPPTFAMGGGAGGMNFDIGTLAGLAADPYASPEQKAIINALIQQQTQAMDPMYRSQLEEQRLKVEGMKGGGNGMRPMTQDEMTQWGIPPNSGTWGIGPDGTPKQILEAGGGAAPAGFQSLDMQAQAAGFMPGTPEYQEFMKSGGEVGGPASFRALDMQAKAAGYVEGTPEYQEFMASRGAGDIAAAKARGEDEALFESVDSKMAGLEEVVGQLDSLADQATYTQAGQARDWVKAQLGGEPSPAAIARAEYIAMVDNQVLPMLRDTFGAAFTVKEGETLRATLGDANKTPAEKKAVLRAFIKQKRRDLEALGKRTGQEPSSATEQPTKTELIYNPATGELE